MFMLKNVLCMILALSLLAVFPVMAAAKDAVSVENFKTLDSVIPFLTENNTAVAPKAPYAKIQYFYLGGGIAFQPSCNQQSAISYAYTVYGSANGIYEAVAPDGSKFGILSKSYSLSPDNRTRYVTVTGSYTDTNGYNDLVMRTYRDIIFSADD